MYKGKLNIKDIESYNKRREEIIKVKSGAVMTAESELSPIINWGDVASEYFGRSEEWLRSKFLGCALCKSDGSAFNSDEYKEFAAALRHIANRLASHADEIEAADMKFDE